jgi:hypothetical protein
MAVGLLTTMKMKKRVLREVAASLLWALAICSSVEGMSQPANRPQEQMKFSAEDQSVQQPAKIPADVWAVLQKDSSVLHVLSSQNLGADQLPAAWFAVSEVHLNGARASDLIVVGKGLLQGANVTTFWVFTRGPAGMKLVLSVPAHDLAIRTSRTNGYRDIQVMMATAGRVSAATFRFDGQKYQAPKKRKNDPD